MTTHIPLSKIYHSNHLLADFINQSEKLKPFYEGHPSNPSDWKNIIKRRTDFPLSRRNEVADVLRHQSHSTNQKVLNNIDLLRKPNTFALVTGQQAGFFGGPLYTFFKTLSTIKWAEQLKKQFPEQHFVPIFWLEIEDHDFKEIAGFTSPENATLFFSNNDSNTYQQIAHRKIPSEFSNFLTTIFSSLQDTDFKNNLEEKITTFYKEGESYGEAFKQFMHFLFDEYGLIICDPTDVRLKKIAKPIFEKEILSSSSEPNISNQTKRLIQAGYTAQVIPRQINTFFVKDGVRLGIIKEENTYFLQGSEQTFSQEELVHLLDHHPEYFSPNVVLRPLYQDFILPTIGISVGPGELSYFMQFKSNYDDFGIPFPILTPRAFGLILEPAIERLLDKLALNIESVLTTSDLQKFYLEQNQLTDYQQEFAKLKSIIENLMTEKSDLVKNIDSTLDDTWKSQIGKTIIGIDQFEQRLAKSIKRNENTALNQIKRIQSHVLPEGHPQERTISILYYLAKYGTELISSLYEQIETSSEFQIFYPKTTEL